jgi:hypothetical protein
LARSPTASAFRPMPASTTSSMLASSSLSGVSRRPPRRHYRHFFTVACCLRLSVCCAPVSAMASGTSWSSGRVCLRPRRHGSRSTPSARSTPHSSSRTSCSSRGGGRCYGGQGIPEEEQEWRLRSMS